MKLCEIVVDMSTAISQSFVKILSKTKNFCKQTADTYIHWRHLLMCTACTCTGYIFSLEVLKVLKVSFFLEKSLSGTG